MSYLRRLGNILAVLTLIFSFSAIAEIETPPTDAVWIDTRTSEEYVEGHLEQAALIPYDVIVEGVAALELPKDAPIYLYCRSGNRAGQAKIVLEANSYTNVINVGSLESARTLANKAN